MYAPYPKLFNKLILAYASGFVKMLLLKYPASDGILLLVTPDLPRGVWFGFFVEGIPVLSRN
jgi:hypothetical protein